MASAVLLPVEDEDEPSQEAHPWEWLAQLGSERGLDVTAELLRSVPYTVLVSQRVIDACDQSS